jgi:hypothetical protein
MRSVPARVEPVGSQPPFAFGGGGAALWLSRNWASSSPFQEPSEKKVAVTHCRIHELSIWKCDVAEITKNSDRVPHRPNSGEFGYMECFPALPRPAHRFLTNPSMRITHEGGGWHQPLSSLFLLLYLTGGVAYEALIVSLRGQTVRRIACVRCVAGRSLTFRYYSDSFFFSPPTACLHAPGSTSLSKRRSKLMAPLGVRNGWCISSAGTAHRAIVFKHRSAHGCFAFTGFFSH